MNTSFHSSLLMCVYSEQLQYDVMSETRHKTYFSQSLLLGRLGAIFLTFRQLRENLADDTAALLAHCYCVRLVCDQCCPCDHFLLLFFPLIVTGSLEGGSSLDHYFCVRLSCVISAVSVITFSCFSPLLLSQGLWREEVERERGFAHSRWIVISHL